MLNNNYLRALPYELGKLFQLTTLGLKAISSKSRKKSFHNLRAILLGLMYCNCSPKLMAQENSWTSCWTTWQCLQATHSPGEQIIITKCHNFMSIFQALDPAAAFGQGQPHRPLHSHVLQCSLRQVTASLSHVFPAKLLLLLFLNSQKNQQLCLVQVCNAQSLWLLPAVGAQLGIQVQSNEDMVWELFYYSSSAGRKAFWMKCVTMQRTSLPCKRLISFLT